MGGNPSRVRVTGPLTVFAEGFAGELARLGYTQNAAADQLRLMAHLSRWMAAGRLDVADLLRISRWSLYQLIWSGQLHTLTIGRRRLVRPVALAECLDQLDRKAA